ncbi:g942 [Coccomyxa viridis]|uniref:G942 protein n=1 Tax=Coccomyxa viridis TaxID=1274662 RepID=A0ABP1FGV6_9CHLO
MNPSVPSTAPPAPLILPSSVTIPVRAQPYVKRQQEYISEDVWRCCNPDIQTPFRNLQDALDRLLPYHVFHTEDGGEAEKDICKADDGTPISQQEAAKQQTVGKAAALLDKIQKLESQIAAEEAERAAPGKARAEEEYYLATLVAGAERKEIARLQKEAQDEAKRQLEARMNREMETQRALAQQLASQAVAAALAASSAAMPPQSAGLPPASQPVQQPLSVAQPAAPAPVVIPAAPASAPAASAPSDGAIAEPKLEPNPEPEQDPKPESGPAKGEPGGWSGWSGWE